MTNILKTPQEIIKAYEESGYTNIFKFASDHLEMVEINEIIEWGQYKLFTDVSFFLESTCEDKNDIRSIIGLFKKAYIYRIETVLFLHTDNEEEE